MSRQLMGLRQLSRRTITSSARRQIDNTVTEKQKLFQEDNGIPIHLKGGSKDALLYRATMTLTVFESGSHTSYQWLDPIVITEADFESEMTGVDMLCKRAV